MAAEQRLALLWDPDILRGSALLAQGAIEQAIVSIRAGLAAREAADWQIGRQYQMTLVSEALQQAGDRDGAVTALAMAERLISTSGERWWEAEIDRLKGTLLLSAGSLPEAQASFEAALRIARAQNAKSLELRAAISLARLWGEAGRRTEGVELLAPIYDWFTEGFETADLREAKELLETLA